MKKYIPATEIKLPEYVNSSGEFGTPYENLSKYSRTEILTQILGDYRKTIEAIRIDDPYAIHVMSSELRQSLAYLGFFYESVATVYGNKAFNNTRMSHHHYSIIKDTYTSGISTGMSGDHIVHNMLKKIGYGLSMRGIESLILEKKIPYPLSAQLRFYAQPQYVIPNVNSKRSPYSFSDFMTRLAEQELDSASTLYPGIVKTDKPIKQLSNLLEQGVVDEDMLAEFEQNQRSSIPEAGRIDISHQIIHNIEESVEVSSGIALELDGPFAVYESCAKLIAAYSPPNRILPSYMSLSNFTELTGMPARPGHFVLVSDSEV